MLASRTTPAPVPDGDEINRVYEEGWVRSHALAFTDDTLVENGGKISELFTVDLPQDEAGWKQPGGTPLAGIVTTMPASPVGANQRRLTFTYHHRYPGLVDILRHWMRANPQVIATAFLMHDDAGVMQLWLISPQGGEPRQLTYYASGV